MNEIVIVGEAVAGEAAKTLNQVKKLLASIDRSEFDLSDLLHKVKKNGFFKPQFETFTAYCESIGLKESRMFYLPKIAEVMEQVGIPRDVYEPVGKSKLREIVSLDPQGDWTNPTTGEVTPMRDFITEMVNNGANMPLKEVKEHVRTLKGLVGENNIVNRTFGWSELTIKETIDPAIELAKRHIGSVGRDEDGNAIDPSDSRAVEVALADFLSDPNNNILPDDFDEKHGLKVE